MVNKTTEDRLDDTGPFVLTRWIMTGYKLSIFVSPYIATYRENNILMHESKMVLSVVQ